MVTVASDAHHDLRRAQVGFIILDAAVSGFPVLDKSPTYLCNSIAAIN
jgi:hypothetical protein